jgi:hypothetical protein
MEVTQHLSAEEATRLVLSEGTYGEYCDVVREVRRRFGLRISEGLVERLYLAAKRNPAPTPRATVSVDVKPEAHLTPPAATHSLPADTPATRGTVLRFVEEMGGFTSARAAIDRLEHSIGDLMN